MTQGKLNKDDTNQFAQYVHLSKKCKRTRFTTMLTKIDNRSYTPRDFEVFNLIAHPIWVFNIERKAMFWANEAALEVWNADSLPSLLARDFASNMSKATACCLKELLAKISRKDTVNAQRTLYPRGRATTLIDLRQIVMLVEAELLDKKALEKIQCKEWKCCSIYHLRSLALQRKDNLSIKIQKQSICLGR
jgi:hypothetical protein